MSEIKGQMSLILPDDEPRWSPEIEEQVELGSINTFEADELEGLAKAVPSVSPSVPEAIDDEEDKEIERMVSQGVSNYGSARIKVHKNSTENKTTHKVSRLSRKAGSKAKTAGDTTSASDGTWSNFN
jgi:hypothetical protein